MDLHVYARDTPMFSFQPGAVKLGIQGAVKAFAIQPNGTQTPLFQLNIVSGCSSPSRQYKQKETRARIRPSTFTSCAASSCLVLFHSCASILDVCSWDM